jgi:spoIIIJ-associated protein
VGEIERNAASVEEAVEAALEELGISEQEAQIEIVQEPRSGFLGIASQPAIVRVRSLSKESVGPSEPEEDQGELVASFVDGLMASIGLDVDVEINELEGTTYVDVWGASSEDDMGLMIGKRGHTLDSIQEIVRSYVHHETGTRCQVLVDVEDYRKRRRSQILRRARETARRVKKTGKSEGLEPMSAYERKIIHDAVGAMGGLETTSEGEEPSRRVVISPRRREAS